MRRGLKLAAWRFLFLAACVGEGLCVRLRDRAQLWSAGHRPIVLALYLRGEPFHRIVCDVDDPVAWAAVINQWIDAGRLRCPDA